MKKIFTCLVVLCAISTIAVPSTFGQQTLSDPNSCPQIMVTSFQIIPNPENPCFKTVSIDYYNPTNGAKSMRITATCSGTTVFDSCYDASKNQGLVKNIITKQFTCCDLSKLNIVIAAYTGNNSKNDCTGTPCVVKWSIGGSPLPVYYKSFTAARNKSAVELKWTTAFEQNNRGFEIEKQSAGSSVWTTVAFVPTTAPSGNSSSDISYSYSDLNNQSGITNYRIRQIDLDGKVHFSEVRSIRGLNDEAKKVEIFPNPGTSGRITILFKDANQQYDVTLIDASGRTVKQWNSVTGSSLSITNLTRGFYNLRVLSKRTGEQSVSKFIMGN